MPTTDKMLIVCPHEMWTYGATTTGTVDSDYEPAWLTDARPGYPVRGEGGSPSGLSLSMTGPAGVIGIMAIHHHNLIVPVTIGGDVSATITPSATRPPNGVQLDAFTLIEPAVSGVDSLTFAVSGNDETPIVGEFLAGQVREVTPIKIDDADLRHDDFADPPAGLALSVMPYDPGIEARRLTGTQMYNGTDLAVWQACWQAQRGGTKPMLLIPHHDVNDPWVVSLQAFHYRPWPKSADLYLVTLDFVEYPRSRW